MHRTLGADELHLTPRRNEAHLPEVSEDVSDPSPRLRETADHALANRLGRLHQGAVRFSTAGKRDSKKSAGAKRDVGKPSRVGTIVVSNGERELLRQSHRIKTSRSSRRRNGGCRGPRRCLSPHLGPRTRGVHLAAPRARWCSAARVVPTLGTSSTWCDSVNLRSFCVVLGENRIDSLREVLDELIARWPHGANLRELLNWLV